MDIMFDVPNMENISECIITKDTGENNSKLLKMLKPNRYSVIISLHTFVRDNTAVFYLWKEVRTWTKTIFILQST